LYYSFCYSGGRADAGQPYPRNRVGGSCAAAAASCAAGVSSVHACGAAPASRRPQVIQAHRGTPRWRRLPQAARRWRAPGSPTGLTGHGPCTRVRAGRQIRETGSASTAARGAQAWACVRCMKRHKLGCGGQPTPHERARPTIARRHTRCDAARCKQGPPSLPPGQRKLCCRGGSRAGRLCVLQHASFIIRERSSGCGNASRAEHTEGWGRSAQLYIHKGRQRKGSHAAPFRACSCCHLLGAASTVALAHQQGLHEGVKVTALDAGPSLYFLPATAVARACSGAEQSASLSAE
jgi:hypothetical protein